MPYSYSNLMKSFADTAEVLLSGGETVGDVGQTVVDHTTACAHVREKGANSDCDCSPYHREGRKVRNYYNMVLEGTCYKGEKRVLLNLYCHVY